MKNFKTLFTSWSLSLLFTTVYAEVKTPGIFSDRMVLQRESPIPLWGWAAPKETITITFAGKEYQTKANRTGDWSIKLPKHKAGGPYELKINQKQFQDVYVGDVYLCSGQSNMELTVKRVLDKYKNEIMCYENNLIRYTKTEYAYHFVKPQASSVHTWKTCTKKDALDFAALCYFFAKEMQAQEKVAIGIINSSWGGTNIAAWLSRKSLEKSAVFRKLFQTDLYTNPNYPDSIKTIESTQTSAWYRKLSENDLGKKENWIESNFDDSQWNQVDMFSSNWGGEWRAPINGVHYFRQRFSLPASLASQKAILRVGTIKDADETFINGVKVGSTSYEFPPRIYKVPENILRAGENEIVIRLISNSGRPTFIKDKLYQLELENKIIPLSTIWRHKIGCVSNRIPPSTSFQNMPTGLYNNLSSG